MKDVLGIINLCDSDNNLGELTEKRALGATHLLGRYRLIDFILSNMSNSGIHKVGIFINTKAHSIIQHIGSGKPWDLDRKHNGLRFFINDKSGNGSFSANGDLSIFNKYLYFLKNATQKHVLISQCQCIFNIDLEKFYQDHLVNNADVSVLYKNVADAEIDHYIGCDTLAFNSDHELFGVGKNIGLKDGVDVTTGIYLIGRELLINIIEKALQFGNASTIREAGLSMLSELRVVGFRFDGFMRCINSIDNYFDASMEVLNPKIYGELFFENGPIYTKIMDDPTTLFSDDCDVSNSIIANGCVIDGVVENCIIHRNVVIKRGAVVTNSILFPGVIIDEASSINYAIIDKNATITSSKHLSGHKSSLLIIKKNTIV